MKFCIPNANYLFFYKYICSKACNLYANIKHFIEKTCRKNISIALSTRNQNIYFKICIFIVNNNNPYILIKNLYFPKISLFNK